MEEKTDFYVAGYCFASIEDAKQAQKEEKEASYFESKLRGKEVQNILAAYDNILDEKVFKTPVGWEYLKRLQDKIREMGMEEDYIRPIPMYISYVHDEGEQFNTRQRVQPIQKKEDGASKLRLSVFFNILLAIMVAVMFMIAVSSENPNILNYETTIINKYASWSQELTERENKVREKEAELFTD